MSSSRRTFFLVVLTISLVLSFNLLVFADVLVVSSEGKGFDSIQAAVNRAEPGDTLLIKPGDYKANFSVDKRLTLKGKGTSRVSINGNSRGSPVLMTGPSSVEITLVNLTLKGASGEICNNRAKGVCPAGLSVTGRSTARLVNSKLIGNGRDGLRIISSGRATLKNSEIRSNKRYGIWMSGSSSASISNTSVIDNKAGIEASRGSEIDISTSEVSSNDGYGISLFGNSRLALDNSRLSGNGEGGLRLENSSKSTLQGNSLVKNNGQAVLVQSSADVKMAGNKIKENQIGITNHSDGSVVLKSNEIVNNWIDLIGDLAGKSRTKHKKEKVKKISLPDEEYPSFQAAVDALMPGSTIVLEGDIKGGAVIDKKMTIKAEGKPAKLISSRETVSPVISLINGSNLTLIGVKVTGSGGSGIVLGGNARLRIESSTVSDNGSEGIGLWNSSRLTLVKTRIGNNDGSGIRLVDSSRATLTGGDVAGNKLYGVLTAGSARIEIDGSTLTDNGDSGLLLSGKSEASVNNTKISTNVRNGVKFTGESTGYFGSCDLSQNKGSGITSLSSSQVSIEDSNFSGNSSGISVNDNARIEVRDSTFRKNKIGIEFEAQGDFEGKVEGSGNDFIRNDRDLTGAPESIKEKLID